MRFVDVTETAGITFQHVNGATDIEILSGLNDGDQIVTGSFKAKLVFPISNIILSDAGDGTRTLKATVRMPIEKPIPR